MANLVLISEATAHTQYHPDHLRYLVREGFVAGKKQGGIWLIDLDDLKTYEQQMAEEGTQKHTAKRYKGKD